MSGRCMSRRGRGGRRTNSSTQGEHSQPNSNDAPVGRTLSTPLECVNPSSTPLGSNNPLSTPLDCGNPSSTPHVSSNPVSGRDSHNIPSDIPDQASPASKLMIQPCGDEFFPFEAVTKVSSIIKNKYDEPWTDWSHIPSPVKKMWFEEFQKYCTWDAKDHKEIVRLFKHKGASIVRQSLADIRRAKSRGRWLPKKVLLALRQKWKTDDKFKTMSERNKKNIAANKEGRVNRSGNISISEHMRRYKKKENRDVSLPELFLKLNYDKTKDKWHSLAGEKSYESFEQLKNEKLEQGVAADDIDDSSLFIEANGGVDKKGRSWGCGSEVRFHKSSSSYGCFSRPIDPQINASQVSDFQTRLSVMEVENHTLKSNLGAMENKLDNVMSLLQKLAASQMASSESDQHRMSSFNENDDVHDDLDGGDDVHDGLSDGGDGDGDDMDDVNDSHEDDGSDNMDDGDDDSEEW